jgi:hypothetical protein
LELSRAKTAAQRIAILQREQVLTTDQVEKLRIQAQIEGERNSGAKAHTGELGKQLNLEERIRDSKEAQVKASVDARKLAAEDVLDRLKENRQLAAAQRELANPRASSEFKEAAAARIALINANRDERALALQQAQATAGGQIINGRVFQSRPGAPGATPAPLPTPIPPLPAPGAPTGQAAPVAPGSLIVQFLVDGHKIAEEIIPDVMRVLRGGLAQSASAGGGSQ